MGQKRRASAPRHAPSLAASQDAVAASYSGSFALGDVEKSNGSPGNGRKAAGECQTVGAAAANGGGSGEGTRGGADDISNVKGDCEKALVSLRRGNSTKALKLIREACSRYDSIALVQRIHGHICMRLASIIEDANTKQRHLKEAIDAARKAVYLSPQSLEYAHFHAQLLFETATDSKGYEEVVQECKRALSIADPVDPAKDSLNEEGQQKLPTVEARVAHIQQELKGLIQKANFASISTWMKTLGNGTGEEQLRFIPMRRFTEDPMEQLVSLPKRPHEVKKSVKTPEERRKEIEVRVAAARLLQQKGDYSPTQSEGASSISAKGSQRTERRKTTSSNTRKVTQALTSEERIERLKPFWIAVGARKRELLLDMPIVKLKSHVLSCKPNSAMEVLIEALEFAKEKKTWKFWACFLCDEKFIDRQEHAQHMLREHIGSLPPKLRRVLPQEIDHDWADQLMDEDCRPFDGPAAIKLLISESSPGAVLEEPSHESVFPGIGSAGFDSSSDVSDNSISSRECFFENPNDPGNQPLANIDEDVCLVPTPYMRVPLDNNGEPIADCISSHVCSRDCHRAGTVCRLAMEIPPQDLPLAVADDDRTKLLERIYSLFRLLMRNKCLAADHLIKVVRYAVEELQNLVPQNSVHYEFNLSPLYIRFLPAQQLRRIHKYLHELAHACGVDHFSGSNGTPDTVDTDEDDMVQDMLFLNEDITKVLLDEHLLEERSGRMASQGEHNQSDNLGKKQISHKEMGTVGPLFPIIRMKETDDVLHAERQLLWIYGRSEYELQAGGWKELWEERDHQGRDIFRALEKELFSLQGLCEKKCDYINYEEGLNAVERLCTEESKKKDQGSYGSHEVVLKKRQQDLIEHHANTVSSQWKLECEVISSILRDSQSVSVPHLSYDGILSVAPSHISDSDDEEEDTWKLQGSTYRSDSCIEATIHRQKEHLSTEVNKLDAKIMRALDGMQRLEYKLGSVSSLDYRVVVLPLVKSFLKAKLEDAAEEDALRKSDAAREAFLAELALDEKNSSNRVTDAIKLSKEKLKDTKKNKDQKKLKEIKYSSHEAQQRNSMECVIADHDVTYAMEDEDRLESVYHEGAKPGAESNQQVELEAQERKLAETLEFQRRIEEETKQRHLAGLRKKHVEEDARRLFTVEGAGMGSGDFNESFHEKCDLQSENDSLSLISSSDALSSSVCLPKDLDPLVVGLDKLSLKKLGEDNFALDSSTSDRSHVAGRSTSLCPLWQCDTVLPVDDQIGLMSSDVAEGTFSHKFPVRSPLMEPAIGSVKPSAKIDPLEDSEKFPFPTRSRRGNRNRRKKTMQAQEDNRQIPKDDPCGQMLAFNDEIDVLQELHGTAYSTHHENGLQSRPVVDDSKLSSHLPFSQTYNSTLIWKKKQSRDGKGSALPDYKHVQTAEDNGSKTLRQLKAEQDEEDRFQADLEQAMRQSLDMLQNTSNGFHLHETSRHLLESSQLKSKVHNSLSPVSFKQQMSGMDEIGKGLQNDIGQYNCFLNAVIQSLWHLRKFRQELLTVSSVYHTHIGNPCVVCALRDIFVGLTTQSTASSKEPVAPTSLRVALSTLYPQSDFFQEAQMNDASEVLWVVFDSLHRAFTPISSPSDGDSDTGSGYGSWECHDCTPCIAHSLFGLDIAEQMNCQGCGLESRHLKYTTFFHNINASALRAAKIMYQESSLDVLLKLVDMNDQLTCDMEMGGCGRPNYIHHLLRAAPHVFTTVLGWQTGQESVEDISATLDAIETDMDVGVVYRGLDEGYKHHLASVVCYYGQHYQCFAYNHEIGGWVMFDDTTVKVMGTWDDVVDTCRRGHLQPQVLFYEALPPS